jgi:hypothetical protein
MSADAQGVWKQLDDAGKQNPPASRLAYDSMTPQRLCDEAKGNPRVLKCRGRYMSDGFSVRWRGVQHPDISHSPIFEVLVRGDDAIVCFNNWYDMTDTSPCVPMGSAK